MMRQAIVPKLFVALLLTGAFALLGCEGTPDRSLNVLAYAPVDQSGGEHPAMEYVTKMRVGYFSYEDGTYSRKDFTEFNQSNTESGGSNTIRNIPTSGGPYTYVVEGFGSPRIKSMQLCDRANLSQFGCESGWDCESDRESGLDFCVFYVPDGAAARGFSPPVMYNNSAAVEAPVLFSRVLDFAVLTLPDASVSRMQESRFGHKSIAFPDGNVLLVGGAVKGQAGTVPSFPRDAEMYMAENSRFSKVSISGAWSGGRSHFALTDLGLSPDETVYNFLVSGGNTSQGLSNEVFLLSYDMQTKKVSAELLGTMPNKLALHTATLISDDRVLIAGGITETDADGEFLRPVAGALIVNLNSETIVTAGEDLEVARFMHTATRTPNDKVLIIGGFQMVNGNSFVNRGGANVNFWDIINYDFANTQTVNLVDVYHADSDEFASFDYALAGITSPDEQLSRGGHVAIPLYDEMASSDTGRWAVAVYGGFAYDEIGENNEYQGQGLKLDTPYIFNAANEDSLDVTFVWAGQDANGDDIDGMANFTTVPLPTGYNAIMNRANPNSPHGCTNAEWSWLGTTRRAVLITGGLRPNLTDTSDWGEIISFSGSPTSGYTLGEITFGPEVSTHVMRTPYRTGSLNSGGRIGHSTVQLRTGQVLITGGTNEGTSLNSAEIYNPPTDNSWGNRFEAVSDL